MGQITLLKQLLYSSSALVVAAVYSESAIAQAWTWNAASIDQQLTVGDQVSINLLDYGQGNLTAVSEFVILPAGLSLSGLTISGIPTTEGTSTTSILATAPELSAVDFDVNWTISAAPVNSTPEAVNDDITVQQGQLISIDVLDNDTDADGNTLSVTAVRIIGDASNFTATQVGDFIDVQSDTLVNRTVEYDISDGNGGADTGQIILTVTAQPNTPPTAIDDDIYLDTDLTLSRVLDVVENDMDDDAGDVLSVTSVHGNAILSGGQPITLNSGAKGVP